MSDEDQLTPAERELVRALQSLRPAPARIDVAAAALAAERLQARRRARLWQGACAAAALFAVVWLAFSNLGRGPQPANGPGAGVVAIDQPAVQPATVLVYRRALLTSPAELDALLDRQAALGGPADDSFTPVGVAMFRDANAQHTLGEM